MHGDFQPAPPDLVETTETKQPKDWPVIAVLALGGVLTLAWAAFLLWVVIHILIWIVS